MATVSTYSCGFCDALLLRHIGGRYECPECDAEYIENLLLVTPGDEQ